jgi:hypothetical protein
MRIASFIDKGQSKPKKFPSRRRGAAGAGIHKKALKGG